MVAVENFGGRQQPPTPTQSTHMEVLFSRFQEAAEKGSVGLVKDLLQEVSKCCTALEAKVCRKGSSSGPNIAEGQRLPVGGWKYCPEFMLWSVLLSNKLNLNCTNSNSSYYVNWCSSS